MFPMPTVPESAVQSAWKWGDFSGGILVRVLAKRQLDSVPHPGQVDELEIESKKDGSDHQPDNDQSELHAGNFDFVKNQPVKRLGKTTQRVVDPFIQRRTGALVRRLHIFLQRVSRFIPGGSLLGIGVLVGEGSWPAHRSQRQDPNQENEKGQALLSEQRSHEWMPFPVFCHIELVAIRLDRNWFGQG